MDSARATKERDWLECARLHALPEMDFGARGHAVVVAPHPDDETLALGGTVHQLARDGWRITIIGLTDGGASHPRSRTVTPRELVQRRAGERLVALARLGLSEVRVVRLELPDGGVGNISSLSTFIAGELADATWCFAPWRRDGHPDHDATGIASYEAAARLRVRFAEYPVWAWHWADPAAEELPWSHARRVPISPESAHAKLDAIDAYRSQTDRLSDQAGDEAILSTEMLLHFHRPFEILFV
jgi:LmbE family N-acetylglucosaminyl deacetylase